MNKTQTPEDVAGHRLQLIAPLLEDGLDKSQLIEIKKRICQEHQLSYRTIGRYHQAYLEQGFAGLKPNIGYKRKSNQLPENFPDIIDEAIQLRRECPTRSVMDIIRILELEEVVKPGILNRSTLQRHMQAKGFGMKQIKMYTTKGKASRRFAKPHRMMLLQGDIKYGPYLPIGEDGASKQVYLSAFIDDATRYIVAGKFYDNQSTEVVEDTLRTAIMHYGKPNKIFVDNGKQYKNKWLQKACNRLGIRLVYSKPYHPEGKGKIEYFNRRIDSFLSEAALNKHKSLEDLNQDFQLWLEAYYHKNPHSSLDGRSPATAFSSDSRRLNFVDASELQEVFLHSHERQVDKTGCISFEGQTYEVGVRLIGRKVEVYHDPTWVNEVEIRHKDLEPFKAKVQVIGANCGVESELPGQMSLLEPEESRLLKALNKSNITHRTNKETAISFKDLGGESYV